MRRHGLREQLGVLCHLSSGTVRCEISHSGLLLAPAEKHHGATEDARLKNVLTDNCANLASKQVHRILHMLHIPPCSHLPKDALVLLFSFFFFLVLRTKAEVGLAPEEASQSQRPWDEPSAIARHYIMMVSHSLGLRDCKNTDILRPRLYATAQPR